MGNQVGSARIEPFSLSSSPEYGVLYLVSIQESRGGAKETEER